MSRGSSIFTVGRSSCCYPCSFSSSNVLDLFSFTTWRIKFNWHDYWLTFAAQSKSRQSYFYCWNCYCFSWFCDGFVYVYMDGVSSITSCLVVTRFVYHSRGDRFSVRQLSFKPTTMYTFSIQENLGFAERMVRKIVGVYHRPSTTDRFCDSQSGAIETSGRYVIYYLPETPGWWSNRVHLAMDHISSFVVPHLRCNPIQKQPAQLSTLGGNSVALGWAPWCTCVQ